MSFEAVPCRFRAAPGPQGEETEYIGLLIRPAGDNSQQPSISQVARVAQPPVAPVRVIPAGEAQRLLVPANVQVRLAPTTSDGLTSIPMTSTWQPAATTRVVNSTFSSPPPNISSPCPQQPRSLSVCSSSPMTASSPMSPPPQQHYQQNGTQYRPREPGPPRPWLPGNDSSTTPDSGIQSVPGSPPSNHRDTPPTIEACTSVCEERPEEEDFADMPRLIAIDQEEDYCAPGPSGLSGLKEEHSTTGSECETTAPVTLSITPLMDNAKISEQLIQLDPAKAFEIAQEIHKRMGLQEKLEKTKKRRTVKKENPAVKKRRPNSAASDELKKSEEEVKEQPAVAASSPETRDCPSPSANFTPSDSRKLYREAVKRMMERQVVAMFEKTMMGLRDLHIGERERHERRKIQKKVFSVDFEALKKRRKREEDRVLQWKKKTWASYKEEKKVPKEEEKVEKTTPKKTERKRKHEEVPVKVEEVEELPATTSRRPSRTSVRTPSKRRNTGEFSSFDSFDKRSEVDFEEIPKSVCETSLPGWTVPIVRCGCTRGSCSSDAECINRALFVQCPSNCHAHMCINKKFWKNDAVRHLSTGSKSKRHLQTKVAKRAGEFLGEFAGEVVSYSEAVRRWNSYKESEEIPRILSISPNLFVDATKKGNITQFVRHSCKPNSRLEVWSINGHLRAGLFPLYDFAPQTEITISMNGLLPVGKACTSCSESSNECCRWVKRSRNAVLSSAEPLQGDEEEIVKSSRVFLRRNRTKTIRRTSKNYVHRDASIPSTTQECLSKILNGLHLRIRNVDGSLPLKAVVPYSAVRRAVESGDFAVFHSAVENLLEKLDDDDLDRVYSALSNHFLGTGEGKDKKHHLRNREVDLSYLDLMNTVKVGSYNPDGAWPKGSANKRADAVRCECGSLEEDGKMLQCDACNFWLHTDCIGNIDDNLKYYQCRLCSGVIPDGIPSTDVKLGKQPDVRFEGCIYYKALVNRRNIQVRQFETVYVEKTPSDDHKKILRNLTEVNEKGKKKKMGEEKREYSESPISDVTLDPPGHRKDLRIFRVERLFTAPGGHRFVFGFYYARPHETICDSQKMFHRNEVFATPFYDTLPLDSVVGRCAVLDPDVYISGRPTVPKFKEEDILVCDYQIDNKQRSFEKIPVRNRFPINTQPYVFAKFDSPRPLIRDFTPFVVGDRSSSRASGRVSRTENSIKEFQNKHRAEIRLESVVSRLKNVTSSPEGEVKPGRKRKRSHRP